jgi:hypothetical protein
VPPILTVCLIMLALGACASHKPIYTSASYSMLPASGSRVSVVVNNMAILATAETWLQDRGLYVVPQNTAQTNTKASTGAPCLDRCERAAALETAKAAGADYAILVNVSMAHAPERLSIVIKGFATKTSEEIFQAEGTKFLGKEWMHPEDKNEALNHIFCHALATVWRYRPGGLSDDQSDHYCHIPPSPL